MQKKASSEFGFLNLRTMTGCALFCAATLLVGFALTTPKLQSAVWRAKVDPSVLAAAANGQTEFLIYMSSVADLSAAKSLRTKAEKGKYVYEKLTATAEASQPAVRQTLDGLGAEYRSFWISNVIWAKGSLAVIEAVAPLAQVAYITPSPAGGLQLPQQQIAPALPKSASPDSIDAIEPSLISVHADMSGRWVIWVRAQLSAGADTGVAVDA